MKEAAARKAATGYAIEEAAEATAAAEAEVVTARTTREAEMATIKAKADEPAAAVGIEEAEYTPGFKARSFWEA